MSSNMANIHRPLRQWEFISPHATKANVAHFMSILGLITADLSWADDVGGFSILTGLLVFKKHVRRGEVLDLVGHEAEVSPRIGTA